MIQAGINGNKFDNMNPKTLIEPQIVHKIKKDLLCNMYPMSRTVNKKGMY